MDDEATPFIAGTWPNADARRQFVEGAKWMFYTLKGATMFSSERHEAEAEAERRFPNGVVPHRRMGAGRRNKGEGLNAG